MDLKDLKRGGRRIMIWTILLVIGCIQYPAAAAGDAPTDPEISVLNGGTKINTVLWSVVANATAELKCKATDGDQSTSNALQYMFMKGTTDVMRDWEDPPVYNVADFDKTKADEYSCKARDSASATKESVLATLALTLECSDDKDCGSDDKVTTCDTTLNKFCKCKINVGVFPAGCDACSKSEDCGANQVCTTGSPKACACGTYGGKLPKCNACNVTTHQGCEATSAKPRCAGTPSECTGCDNKFCEKFGKGKPECDTSKGSCKAKTSGAATVTATACVAIASIFIALIN